MSDPITSPAEDGAGREAALAWLQVYNLAGPNTGDGPHSKLDTLTREFESFGRHAKASAESRAAAAEAEVARLRAERQRCDARIHNQRAVLREWGPETHATRAADARLRLIALVRKKSAANRAAEASASALRDRVKALEEALTKIQRNADYGRETYKQDASETGQSLASCWGIIADFARAALTGGLPDAQA